MGFQGPITKRLDAHMNEKLSLAVSKPKISVIMACFNSIFFVSEAVESILNQTFRDFELILIDDGSSDSTLDIIRRYELKDNRIIVIEKQNTGAADSRNKGIFLSRGDWIAILDSDDIALPMRLEEQFEYAAKNPGVLMVGSDCITIDKEGSPIKKHSYPVNSLQLKNRLRRNMAFPPHSSVLYRADVVKRLGGFNTRFVRSQDWDLWLRLAEEGQIACLNRPLVKIRKHSSNISYSEGGNTQSLYGFVAIICHFLRNKSFLDPSTSDDETDWRAFLAWVSLRMKQEGHFEKQNRWVQLKQAYYSPVNRMSRVWRLTKGIATSRNMLGMICEKFFGSDLPETLANEWSQKCQRSKYVERNQVTLQ